MSWRCTYIHRWEWFMHRFLFRLNIITSRYVDWHLLFYNYMCHIWEILWKYGQFTAVWCLKTQNKKITQTNLTAIHQRKYSHVFFHRNIRMQDIKIHQIVTRWFVIIPPTTATLQVMWKELLPGCAPAGANASLLSSWKRNKLSCFDTFVTNSPVRNNFY